MTWKPRHEAHAIERVRVLFEFREPIPSKVLAKSAVQVTGRFTELGFDAVSPAESSIATIRLQPNAVPEQQASPRNGFVVRRLQDGSVAEEVGFRDLVFGYLTTTYGRWEAMKNRLEEVMLPVLDAVSDVAELDKMKLEYWDSFYFDGEPANADVSEILSFSDASIPEAVLKGGSLWHSHVGWLEGDDPLRMLLNRNVDVIDRIDADGTQRRVLGMYTLVEKRSSGAPLDFQVARGYLEEMHTRSLQLFGSTLVEGYRKKLGINLDSYK